MSTMMECDNTEDYTTGFEELLTLATDIADTTPNVHEAAERILTLLGVNEDTSSYSEDEGVEVDENDDIELELNAKRLHQLAASLTEEFKYSQKQQISSTNSHSTSAASPSASSRSTSKRNSQIERMEFENNLEFNKNVPPPVKRAIDNHSSHSDKEESFKRFRKHRYNDQDEFSDVVKSSDTLDHRINRYRGDESEEDRQEKDVEEIGRRIKVPTIYNRHQNRHSVYNSTTNCWNSGWDACATETIRYLVQDEGLEPHHPTVIAMKNHLAMQKERVFSKYFDT